MTLLSDIPVQMDEEWIQLIVRAKRMGLKISEIKEFIEGKRESQTECGLAVDWLAREL